MRLALIYGPKSQNMAEIIKTIKDNIDIDCFNDIPEFIDMSLKRNIVYDRLLMPSTFANESTLADLEQFWRSYMYNTSIIMLCKAGEDEEKGKYFQKHFVSTNVCAMFVDNKQKNSTILADAISKPMTYINEQYGLNTEMNIEDDEGEVVFMNNQTPTPEETQATQQNTQEVVQNTPMENPVNQAQEVNQVQNQQPVQPPKKEKKSLFGRKKKNVVTPNQPNVAQGQLGVNPMQANQQMQGNVPQMQNNMVQPQNTQSQMQGNVPQMQPNMSAPVQPMPQMPVFELKTPDMSTWPTPDSVMPQFATPKMTNQQMANQQMPNPQMSNPQMSNPQMVNPQMANQQMANQQMNMPYTQQNPVTTDFNMQGFQSQNQVDARVQTTTPEFVQEEQKQTFKEQPIQEEPTVQEDSTLAETDVIQEETPQTQEVQEPTTPEPTNVKDVSDETINFAESFSDDDFGNIAFGNMAINKPNEPKTDVDEVSEDLGAMNLGVAEQAYRDQNEAPKIITKEVVREIVRDSGGSIVNSILSGKNPHVLIVTGDRGTGITSTCLSIASFFCKKTSVLYFDCDTITHGVLSYINYEEFRNFEPTKMSGTKICKSSKVFSNCVCKFDDNFDILSSDYSVDVAKEELTCTASVVAEKVVDYGLVIVDCPAENLECISDLLISGNTIVCVDSSKRGFMNMLCALENSPLALRYKKLMVNKGIMFLTKYNKNIDIKRIVDYVDSIYDPEGVNWLSMHNLPFTGKVDTKILDRVFTK